MTDAKELAKNIVGTDVRVNQACAAMIAAKQVYMLARYAIHEQLVASHNCQDENDEIEHFIVEAMSARGEEPFTRDELLQKVQNLLAPFVISEIKLELESEETKENLKKTQAKIYKDYGRLEFCDGVSTEEVDPGDTLLIFSNDVPQIVDFAAEHLEKLNQERPNPLRRIHLLPNGVSAPLPTTKGSYKDLRVPFSRWQSLLSTNAEKGLTELARYLSGSPDVLFIHNAADVCGNSAENIDRMIAALRSFCDRRRCALWVAVPKLPDLTEKEYYDNLVEALACPRRKMIVKKI